MVYIARKTFWARVDGRDRLVTQGMEIEETDPVLRGRKVLFDSLELEPEPPKRRRGRPRKNPD